ncbi:tRNA (adenosine(37)-N6)-dimethylallyltransferase MiaA [Microbacterium sp. ET2]|uniref:tRNA (adenosine(37)-N6)-dimethylallyltransferase MiaA n=1 Tax=Microbacterium albipurpureum TaxID=3050384 RepID=UPI00259D24B2|nr:tRNA (adenosine(37)-N6)-dimethylallyltransferase MiaA [Microbacterium sp. ET2 (Ac-2212)]WJL95296.1 tRNA (adenosine(37)-N6)-dimethylallyltransferase MiaA [Microbacterium sp. ET2 (Ac-2212)]
MKTATDASPPDRASAEGPRLWSVIGATGTGKSAFALDLVEALRAAGRDAEVVGADAMQLYRGMDIGTAKIPAGERRGIPHHLLDVLDVTDDAAVAWYQSAAREVIVSLHARGADAVLVGGSGLYVSAVLFDFRFPPRDEALREHLEAELDRAGPVALYDRLRSADPAAAARIDPRNTRRIVRALEVIGQGNSTHGGALPATQTLWHPRTRLLGLQRDRSELVGTLDRRVERMWDEGLLDEVADLRRAGLEQGTTAPRAIGYAQALAEVRGEIDRREAISQTQVLTRRYARRQVSWFRRYEGVTWMDGATAGESLAGSVV